MVDSGLCPQDALFLISGETRPELYFFSTQTHSSVWTKGHLSSDLLENPNVATPGCSCHSDSHLQKSFSLPLSPVLRRCWRGCLLKVWGLGQFIPILLGLGCLVGKVDSQQDACGYYQSMSFFLLPISLLLFLFLLHPLSPPSSLSLHAPRPLLLANLLFSVYPQITLVFQKPTQARTCAIKIFKMSQ